MSLNKGGREGGRGEAYLERPFFDFCEAVDTEWIAVGGSHKLGGA